MYLQSFWHCSQAGGWLLGLGVGGFSRLCEQLPNEGLCCPYGRGNSQMHQLSPVVEPSGAA